MSARPSPRIAARARRGVAVLALAALVAPLAAACSDDPAQTAGAGAPASQPGSGDAPGAAVTGGVQTITAAEGMALIAAQPDVQIIDVRTPEEVAEGHVVGAVNLDLSGGVFEAELGSLDPAGTYLLYCRSGNRSSQAAQLMVDAGFTDVYDMGAFADWQAAGGEVATG